MDTRRNSLPSLVGAIKHDALGSYLKSEWDRMEAMDLSDVGYDAFLINGEETSTLRGVRPGQKIRFRIINAGASTYFYFNIGRMRNFTVVSKDGMEVQPTVVNELLIGMGETYDVIFEMPRHEASIEARAWAQDISGYASLLFGHGPREEVVQKERPNPYVMDHGTHSPHETHGGHGDHGEQHGGMESSGHHHGGHHRNVPETNRADYTMLKSVTPTDFERNLIRAQTIELELSGDMERYTWYINGKPFSEDKFIEIKENEVITFKFINTTMMHHPMHLHGHFFRLIAGAGRFAPLFHTVDVSPMGTVTIEFHANQPGIWFLHCHNLYHMKMGMSRLVKYEGIEQTEELKADEKKWKSSIIGDSDPFGRMEIAAFSNTLKAEGGINRGRYELEAHFELEGYENQDTHEVESSFRRYFGRFFSVGPGIVIDDHRKIHGAFMLHYVFPGHIETMFYVKQDGSGSIMIDKSIALTERVEINPAAKFHYGDDHHEEDLPWSFDLNIYYNLNSHIGIGGNFKRDDDKDQSVGGGMRIRF